MLTSRNGKNSEMNRKVVPMSNQATCYKDIWGNICIASPNLKLSDTISKWSVSHSCPFIPRETANTIHSIQGWVGLIAKLDTVEKKKVPCPCLESNPDSSLIKIIAYKLQGAIKGAILSEADSMRG